MQFISSCTNSELNKCASDWKKLVGHLHFIISIVLVLPSIARGDEIGLITMMHLG
jgi:hypothetical protein